MKFILDFFSILNFRKRWPVFAFTAACFISYFILSLFFPKLSVLFLIVFFLIDVISIAVFDYEFQKKNASSGESISEFSGITIDYIVNTSVPLSICNSNGKIIWFNKAFSKKFNSNHFGMDVEVLSGHALNNISGFSSIKPTEAEIGESYFEIRSYSFSSFSKYYYILLWDDVSDVKKLEKSRDENETFYAYIVADNFDELMRNDKNGIREASSELESVLKEWSEENGGVLKEYRNDHYLFSFNSFALSRFEEAKFDILDRIRKINIGDSGFNVTVSIGISKHHGNLNEKDRYSFEALELALQRGGDQVVVKSERGIDYYGGKVQSIQKTSKVRARVVSGELSSVISSSEKIIIMGHRSADFDSIGACVGIAAICKYLKKEYKIVYERNNADFRKCIDYLKADCQITDNELIIPELAFEYNTTNTLCIVVDYNNPELSSCRDLLDYSNNLVYIDHHRKTGDFIEQPKISYIEPSASSTCELVSEIIEQLLPSGTLSGIEATVIYTGIMLDTKQFTKNTGVKTFGAALFLKSEGANSNDAQNFFRSSIDDLVNEARFESNVIVYNNCAIAGFSDGDRISASKAADRLLNASGVIASFALCEISGKTHVSCRSSGKINVQLIAEELGGGGHFDSAAALLDDDFSMSLTKLKAAIDKILNTNENTVNGEEK